MGERDPNGNEYSPAESELMSTRFAELTLFVANNPPEYMSMSLLSEWHIFFSDGVSGMISGKFRTNMQAVFGGFRGCPPLKVMQTTEALVREINKIVDSSQKYYDLNGKDEILLDHIIKMSSFMHAKFVNIHPFYDGNGRMSRLLQIWFLSRFKIAAVPIFEDKEEYYKVLNHFHVTDDYKPLYELSLRLIGESAERLGISILN